MVLIGLFGGAGGGEAAGLMGAGAVAVVLGVSLFSPRLVRPLASVAGWPLQRLRRLTGRLARENTQRNPARTAVTAAALMIGLAVVAFVTVFAAGIKGSIASAIDDSFQGELVIQNSDGFSPISPGAAAAARQVPGVQTVSTLRATQAKVEGASGKPRVSALGRDAGQVLTIDWTEGGPATLRGLTDGEVILDKSFASSNGFELGDRVRFFTQIGKRPSLRVVGEFEDNADLLGSALVTQRLDGARLRPVRRRLRLRQAGAGRRRGQSPGGPYGNDGARFPDRGRAQPAGAEGEPGRARSTSCWG